VFVVPSAKLVVVRLGLSLPDDGDEGAEDLVAELIAAIEGQSAFASAASGSVASPDLVGP